MNVEKRGSSGFRYLDVVLEPGETMVTEAGAMSSMADELYLKAKLNGGLFKGLLRKFLGGESLFISYFSNPTKNPLRLTLTNPLPGDIEKRELEDESLFLQPGAYICSTPEVKMQLRYAGFRSLLAKEGLFRLELSGRGAVWFGCFGSLFERDIDGEYIVDSGHLVGYDPGVTIRIQLSNGIFGSFFSGEGLVARLEGKGRAYLQTRSLDGVASWLNPRL